MQSCAWGFASWARPPRYASRPPSCTPSPSALSPPEGSPTPALAREHVPPPTPRSGGPAEGQPTQSPRRFGIQAGCRQRFTGLGSDGMSQRRSCMNVPSRCPACGETPTWLQPCAAPTSCPSCAWPGTAWGMVASPPGQAARSFTAHNPLRQGVFGRDRRGGGTQTPPGTYHTCRRNVANSCASVKGECVESPGPRSPTRKGGAGVLGPVARILRGRCCMSQWHV